MFEVQISKKAFGAEVIDSVNARDLHKWLESKQDFSTWIKKRIKQCRFIENIDFISLHEKVEREIGASNRIEYFISFDMSKHLAMLEKTENGHLVRMYFIEQEKIGRKLSSELMSQFNQAVIELEKFTDLASQAGKTLNLVGKKLKPMQAERVEHLRSRLQPDIFSIESD